MSSPVILDLSRLIFTAWKRTPTGIPRVELAYAEHFIATQPERLSFVVLDAFGRLGVVDPRTASAFVRAIARHWRTEAGSRRAWLGLALRAVLIHAVLLLQTRGSLARLIERRDGPSVYLVISHLHLERSAVIERLKRSGKLRLVYLVHDLIPVVFPEYCPPHEEALTRRRLEAAARLADAVVVNSTATGEAFRRTFGQDRPVGSIVVAPLGAGLAAAPAPPPSPSPAAGAGEGRPPPYFVMVGTIEPRKNHLLILNLWRALRAERGADTPRLVLIGARGWEIENVVDLLERSPPLRGFVEERSGVSDAEMSGLLASARALLMPSFAEGYGLPLAEALALGVPALCSDLPALREVGGEVPEFLDPLDGPGWRAAILDYAADDSPRRQAQLARLPAWRPTSWESHFCCIGALLARLDGARASSV